MAPSQIENKAALGQELAKVRFGKLYRDQGRAVLAYALRRVDDREDAADVVAETFLVAWRRLEEVPIGPRERLWLYAVARRVTANLRRTEGRRTRLAERLAESLRSEALADKAPTGDAAELLRAMRGLDEDDRELLLLVSWEELTPSQAAKVLGISALAARSRLHRARRRLRALLEEHESAGLRNPELDMEEGRVSSGSRWPQPIPWTRTDSTGSTSRRWKAICSPISIASSSPSQKAICRAGVGR